MLFDTYEQQGLLFNMNFKDKTSNGLQAYRGDLVLVEGEIADDAGRRKPPTAIVRQAVLLADGDKLKMTAGFLNELAEIKTYLGLYKGGITPETKALFFVVNIPKPLDVDIDGTLFHFSPRVDGMVWTEMGDELRLEKDDFKGQSAADKVVTMYAGFKDYKPKAEKVSLEAALGMTIEAKRVDRGAV